MTDHSESAAGAGGPAGPVDAASARVRAGVRLRRRLGDGVHRGLVALGRRWSVDDLDRLDDAAFVAELYRRLLGRPPEPGALEHQCRALATDTSRAGLALNLVASEEYQLRQAEGAGAGRPDDSAFVEWAYSALLGRAVEPAGLEGQLQHLRTGLSRSQLLVNLATSDEYIRRILDEHTPIKDLQPLRPDRYGTGTELGSGRQVPLFVVSGDEDLDWLEQAIHDNGYYEKPGVWGLEMDEDKVVMAEVLAAFAPARALELGCASGQLLVALDRLGVRAEGVDISRMALALADPSLDGRLHQGDVLDADLPGPYDLVWGFDIFEHFNPNRLDAYLARVRRLLSDEGWLVVNVPAFGDDPVFGTVFPFYLPGWAEEAAAGRRLPTLEVDRHGYPLHGHLVWADSAWWVARFEAAGLVRRPDVETAVHARWDAYFESHSRARKALYVFSGPARPDGRPVTDRLTTMASSVLGGP